MKHSLILVLRESTYQQSTSHRYSWTSQRHGFALTGVVVDVLIIVLVVVGIVVVVVVVVGIVVVVVAVVVAVVNIVVAVVVDVRATTLPFFPDLRNSEVRT